MERNTGKFSEEQLVAMHDKAIESLDQSDKKIVYDPRTIGQQLVTLLEMGTLGTIVLGIGGFAARSIFTDGVSNIHNNTTKGIETIAINSGIIGFAAIVGYFGRKGLLEDFKPREHREKGQVSPKSSQKQNK